MIISQKKEFGGGLVPFLFEILSKLWIGRRLERTHVVATVHDVNHALRKGVAFVAAVGRAGVHHFFRLSILKS